MIKDFTKEELMSVVALDGNPHFKVFMAWVARALADTHKRIYAASSDRESQILVGGARDLAMIIEKVGESRQRLESEMLPTAPETIF